MHYMNTEIGKLPDGYRRLTPGTLLRDDDVWQDPEDGTWQRTIHGGKHLKPGRGLIYCRKSESPRYARPRR